MRKSVSRKVRRRTIKGEESVVLSNKLIRDIYFIEKVFGKLPKGDYTVTYTPDPEGDFFITYGEKWNKVTRHEFSVSVCFIPDSWAGLRVRREVSIGRA